MQSIRPCSQIGGASAKISNLRICAVFDEQFGDFDRLASKQGILPVSIHFLWIRAMRDEQFGGSDVIAPCQCSIRNCFTICDEFFNLGSITCFDSLAKISMLHVSYDYWWFLFWGGVGAMFWGGKHEVCFAFPSRADGLPGALSPDRFWLGRRDSNLRCAPWGAKRSQRCTLNNEDMRRLDGRISRNGLPYFVIRRISVC